MSVTTKPNPTAARHPYLGKRAFTATAPNQPLVTDLTFVPTWAGVAYVCFFVTVFPRVIVGWRCESHMRTEIVLDAIEVARRSHSIRSQNLRFHSDARIKFMSLRYGERLTEIGAIVDWDRWRQPSQCTGRDGENYYKTEPVRVPIRSGPWQTAEDFELATLGLVYWHDTQRLHGYLGDIRPAEFEAAFNVGQPAGDQMVRIK